MSLDLYVESNTPVQHRSTGVFIRENGETRELTKEEVKEKYGKDVEENVYSDNTLLHINLTHNLTKMANLCSYKDYVNPKTSRDITLYTLLWHPEEILNKDSLITKEYLFRLIDLCDSLELNPDFYKEYNPENGWGSYEQLLSAVKKLITVIAPNLNKRLTLKVCA